MSKCGPIHAFCKRISVFCSLACLLHSLPTFLPAKVNPTFLPAKVNPTFLPNCPLYLYIPLYIGFQMYCILQIHIYIHFKKFWSPFVFLLHFFSLFSYSTITCRNSSKSSGKVTVSIPILQVRKLRLISLK